MAKMSIKKASKGLTRFDLSSNHITTSDFGQIQVSQFLPIVPNDKIHASLFSEARFAPMVVPTFMDVKMYTRAFFVPMSAIWKQFENFYIDKQDSSCYKQLPYITNASFVDFFCNSAHNCSFKVDDDNPFDFECSFLGESGRYLLTERGRIFYKLLLSLGYSVNFTESDTTQLNLLPLLAFMRVAYDYIYPSQYVDSLGLQKYFNVTDQNQASLFSYNYVGQFLSRCCDLLTMPFRQDYFTAAWKELNQSGSSSQNIYFSSKVSDVDDIENYIANNSVATGIFSPSDGYSQQSFKLLSRLYDFITRNNIVGTKYADQIFARFGIGSRKSDKDMSQFIGQSVQNINVVDVTAMTSAQNQDLGELGGKAYMNGSNQLFNFESDEFGYIICLSFLMPDIGYYQGRKRWTTAFQSRLDWYQPEFDMNMRAIRNDELFADFKSDSDYTNGSSNGGNPDGVFGFAPNYTEYKKGNDYLTGDFRLPSLKTNLDSYHLMRDLNTPSSTSPLALNSAFLMCRQHEFDKIFAQPYTTRLPLTWVQGVDYPSSAPEFHGSFYECLCYNDRPIMLHYAASSSISRYWFIVRDLRTKRFQLLPVVISQIRYAFGVMEINEKYAYIVNSSSSQSWQPVWNFLNCWYAVGSPTALQFDDGTWATTNNWRYGTLYRFDGVSATGHASRVLTSDEFLLPYRDYIDHAYIRHKFNIVASRPMVPVSDEFMIQDGGEHINVDVNGNHIV